MASPPQNTTKPTLFSPHSPTDHRVNSSQDPFKSTANLINWLKRTFSHNSSDYKLYQFSNFVKIQEILPELEHLDSGLIPDDSGIFILHDADLLEIFEFQTRETL
ncbi:hypothetical protein, partial [Planktothrix sp.]|uniref:hypothetical protein n=1 Tax=Planktothrix sp. TaxID=3088171 RepID=UPI0038D417E0